MFKYILTYIFVILPFVSFCQKTGSITLISDDDMPVKIYLDNVKQNDSAVSQIRIEGLTDIWYKVQAINKDTSYITRNLLVAGMDSEPVDVTYKIKRLSNGKVRITLYSMYSPDRNFVGPADMVVAKIKLLNTNDLIAKSSGTNPDKPKQINEANYGDSSNIVLKSANKSVNDTSVNKKNKNKVESKITSNKSNPDPKSIAINSNKTSENIKPDIKNKVPVKKCNGWPITKKDFDLMIKTISESKTEPLKLKNAKSLVTGSCFLVTQLDDITATLKTEEARLDFLMYAYSFTIDRPNFFKLGKYFSTPESLKEFNSIHGE